MAQKTLYKVASRPSLLAMTQTKQTIALLGKVNPGASFEIVPLSTNGDRIVDKPLVSFGGTGLFVKELEQALIEGRADFAVHSLKDMPGIQPDELLLAAFPEREDPRDVLLVNGSKSLEPGSIIGTGSPRRQLQLMQMFPGAKFTDLRGNIDTRIKKLNNGDYDAIVLAAAGLNRLSVSFSPSSFLPLSECVPAVGQGALALQCRLGDEQTIGFLQSIDHQQTRIAVTAERAFMQEIGGGCKFPLAAHSWVENGNVHLDCIIGDVNTGEYVRLRDITNTGGERQLGEMLGKQMRKKCAEKQISI